MDHSVDVRVDVFVEDDYAAFERVLEEAFRREPLRILGYCVMPNHWHLVVWPQDEKDRQVSEFCVAHRDAHPTLARPASDIGDGTFVPGPVQSFPVESDEHLYTVLRYVERNPVRANLVQRAQDCAGQGPGGVIVATKRLALHGALGPCRDWPTGCVGSIARRVDWSSRHYDAACRARPAVWQRALAAPDHLAARPGIDLPFPGQTSQARTVST